MLLLRLERERGNREKGPAHDSGGQAPQAHRGKQSRAIKPRAAIEQGALGVHGQA